MKYIIIDDNRENVITTRDKDLLNKIILFKDNKIRVSEIQSTTTYSVNTFNNSYFYDENDFYKKAHCIPYSDYVNQRATI